MTEIPDPQPIPGAPAPAEPGPQAPTPPPAGPLPAAAVGYPHPFVAAPRPPRALWINPERRMHVAAAAIIIGLVCGGAGVGIGWAASDGGGRHGVFPYGPGAGYGRHLRPGPYGYGPLQPNFPTVAPTAIPTPTATH